MRRTLFLVGKETPPEVTRLARYCAWHGDWMSPEDKELHDAGSPTTHGQCELCFQEQMAAIEKMPAFPYPTTPGAA